MLQQGGSSEGRWEAETERRQPTLVGFLLLFLSLGPGLSWMVLLTQYVGACLPLLPFMTVPSGNTRGMLY